MPLAALLAVFLFAHLAGWQAGAESLKPGAGPEAQNMALLGENDLQGRSAYQPSIHRQGDRWIAYIGHHGGKARNPLTGQDEDNGTSIVDVTDPAHPNYLHHIPGQPGSGEGGGAQMTRVCEGRTLPHGDPSKTYLLRGFGQIAEEVWDVTDPAKPSLVTRLEGFSDTHKNWWECDTGIAYLVVGVPGWRTRRMTRVVDLSDPAHPILIRDFGLSGQQPGVTGPVPPELHGPISLGAGANRIYFAYGPGGEGVLQILDRRKLLEGPKEPTDANLLYPQVGRLDLSPLYGAHTSFPLPGMPIPEFAPDAKGAVRDIVMVVGEEMKDRCAAPQQMVLFVDVTVESKPMVISNYNLPQQSGAFCQRGGRFGSHASNESFSPVFYKKLAFISYFNAGVRALDIHDPYNPREVGFFIPEVTRNTCQKAAADAPCRAVIQTNNVENDERGFIYIVDRAGTGLHILRLTGEAAKVAEK
ncbi:MAG: hypothetical protein JOY71_02755 [Acetobacteraceae bacterium]|nr:hypothetical protein [Acetobacteraceae bacterium]MBV8521046.1 hypothetical protein [Acetobacteraceae bacterium]